MLATRGTGQLADALEAHLRLRSSGHSLEVLRQLRDRAWFPDGELHCSLAVLLIRGARRYLVSGGDCAALRMGEEAAELAAGWRWLTLTLPSDLLVAAHAAGEAREPVSDHVRIISPALQQLLREPCAETHLHVGASMSFGWLWTCLMGSIGTTLPPTERLGGAPFGGGKDFLTVILSAATTRLLLCAFLRHGGGSFRSLLGVPLTRMVERLPWIRDSGHARRECLRALGLLAGTAAPAPLSVSQRLYRGLSGTPARSPSAWLSKLAELRAHDPIASWLVAGPSHALPETRFASRALRYLSTEDADPDFALFFWQYQRIRCQLYRYLTEEPGTAGLDWFTRHYARISPLRGPLDGALYACALQAQSRDLRLGALEARTSPAASWIAVRDELRALARQAQDAEQKPGPEVGVIFHFIKEWERKSSIRTRPQHTRLHGDPGNPAFGCRHGSWFWEKRRQALAMATALRMHPELLVLLRGLDVANVELAQPSWLLPPLFRPVQEAAQLAAERLAVVRPSWRVTPLRITLHAGEDFRRLSEGLRRIHEPIECGLLTMGDRIGHGIALGEDPARWAISSGALSQPSEERLDDLLWELERYRRTELGVDSSRVEYVRAEILRLGLYIYSAEPELTVESLVTARLLRFDLQILQRCGYPFARGWQPDGSSERLLWRYLTDAGVFARGQQPIEIVTTDSEVRMLQAAQHWLKGVLGRLEIYVESNPSSNLLIGNYLTLTQHPAFRMQPLVPASASGTSAERGGDAVLLSVNTDNPLTFSSNLADEFAHIYFALLRQRVSAQDALAWLERARQNGWRSRFTLPCSADPQTLAQLTGKAPSRRRAGA